MGLSPAHLDIVRKGMNFVVNEPKGTAYRARIEEPALAMAGKTGSVQVRRISEREHRAGVIKNEDRPWKERDHALFVAYAPLERAALLRCGRGRAWRQRRHRGGAHRPRHSA